MLYHVIGNHLPKSDAKINFGSKQIRALAAKLMLTKVGEYINIERRAHFHEQQKLEIFLELERIADSMGGLLLVIM